MRYKKQYKNSPQVLVSRQTGNSIERDNFSAMYLLNSYSWNYKLFWNILIFYLIFLDFLNYLRNCIRYRKNKTINRSCVKKYIENMYCFPFGNFFTPFYHTICDFSKKKWNSKTWPAGKKQRPDFDSAQKTTLEMIYLIPWTHRSYFVDQYTEKISTGKFTWQSSTFGQVKFFRRSYTEKISTGKFTWQSARLSDTFKSYLKLEVPFLYNKINNPGKSIELSKSIK